MPFITLVEHGQRLAVGQVLSLRPVDDNPTDKFAVGVFDNAGVQLGWVASSEKTVADGWKILSARESTFWSVRAGYFRTLLTRLSPGTWPSFI